MMARPVNPAAQAATDAARANVMSLNEGLPKELLRPISAESQAATDAARASVSKMSGGLVSSAATPNAVEQGVAAMNNWRTTGLDEQGNILTNEQRIARHQAEKNAATYAQSAEGNQALATRNTQYTMPGEPNRTLALRGDRTLATNEPLPAPTDKTLALRGDRTLATNEALAQEALSGNKGIGAVLKGVGRKAIPFVGDAIQGYVYGKEGDSVGRGIAAGLGSLGGRLIGGAAGTAVAPGPGTFVGEVGGSFAGAEGGARLYDRVFGGPKPPAQDQVRDDEPVLVPAPAAAPEEPQRDTRTNQEKFNDAIQNARSSQWEAQEQKFKEAGTPEHYARFRAEVEAKRALESAMGAGVSQDPIVNARTARIMVDSANRLGEATGQDPSTLIPAADPRFPNPVEDTAREVIRRNQSGAREMTPGEAAMYVLSSTPSQYRSPIQEELQNRSITNIAPAEKATEREERAIDRDLSRKQSALDRQASREATLLNGEETRKVQKEANRLAAVQNQLKGIENQIADLSKNPTLAKANEARIKNLNKRYDTLLQMDDRGVNLPQESPEEATQDSAPKKPDASTLKVGDIIQTPRGPGRWDGKKLMPIT
jgi:hypothetical protein